MKKITALSLAVSALSFAVCSGANATQLGFYAGLQAGRADDHYTNSSVGLTSSNIDNVGLGGRLYVGYQFNRNVAAEWGYSHMGSAEFDRMNNTVNRGKIKNRVADVSLKGIVPLDSGFSAYAKVGLARIRGTGNDIIKTTSTQFRSDQTKTTSLMGLGLGYDFTPNTNGEIFWTRHIKTGLVQNIDLFGVGLAYYFG